MFSAGEVKKFQPFPACASSLLTNDALKAQCVVAAASMDTQCGEDKCTDLQSTTAAINATSGLADPVKNAMRAQAASQFTSDGEGGGGSKANFGVKDNWVGDITLSLELGKTFGEGKPEISGGTISDDYGLNSGMDANSTADTQFSIGVGGRHVGWGFDGFTQLLRVNAGAVIYDKFKYEHSGESPEPANVFVLNFEALPLGYTVTNDSGVLGFSFLTGLTVGPMWTVGGDPDSDSSVSTDLGLINTDNQWNIGLEALASFILAGPGGGAEISAAYVYGGFDANSREVDLTSNDVGAGGNSKGRVWLQNSHQFWLKLGVLFGTQE